MKLVYKMGKFRVEDTTSPHTGSSFYPGMNEYKYEKNDLLDVLEKVYYEAKALKDKKQYQEAMDQFKLLIDMDQCYSIVSISIIKFKSLKQLIEVKIKQGEFHEAATLFRQLLDYISKSDICGSTYTISSVEKMLDRIFSLAPSHQADSNEKERLLDFTKNVHEEAINKFDPFVQRKGCCLNENLWLHAYVKYIYFLFRLKEEQRLKELVQKLGYLREEATSVSIIAYRIPSGVLVDFIEILLASLQKVTFLCTPFRFQKDDPLFCIGPYQQNKIKSFIQRYEEKKIALGCILSNCMHEMGLIHEHAGKLYMASSTYDKAYSSLIEACKCWKHTSNSHAHEHCVKLLYIAKMLHGSTSTLEEDVLGDISPSEALLTMTKVFDAFRSGDIGGFEKYMKKIDKDCVLIKEGIVRVHKELWIRKTSYTRM